MQKRLVSFIFVLFLLSVPGQAQNKPAGPLIVDFGAVLLKGPSGTLTLGKLSLPADLRRVEIFLSETKNYNYDQGPGYSLRPFLCYKDRRIYCVGGNNNLFSFFSDSSFRDHPEQLDWLNEVPVHKGKRMAECGLEWHAGSDTSKKHRMEAKVLAGAVLYFPETLPLSPEFPQGLTSFTSLIHPIEPFGFFNRDITDTFGGGEPPAASPEALSSREKFLRSLVTYLKPGFWRSSAEVRVEDLMEKILPRLENLAVSAARSTTLPEYESVTYLCSRILRDSDSKKAEEFARLLDRTRLLAEREFFATSDKFSPGATMDSFLTALERNDHLKAARDCLQISDFFQCWHFAAFDPRASGSLYLSANLDLLLSMLSEAIQAERRTLPAGAASPPASLLDFPDNSSSAGVLVVDVSGSMREELGGRKKLALAKNASLMMLDVLSRGALAEGNRHMLAVVAFSVPAIVEVDLTDDYETVKSAIRAIHLGSNTNIGDGLIRALEILERVPDSVKAKNIILLSDGMPNTGLTKEEILTTIPRKAKKKGIRIFTVGFKASRDYDEKFMQALARLGGGDYYYVEQADTLGDTLLRIRHSATGRIIATFSGALFPGISSQPYLFQVPPGAGSVTVTIQASDQAPLFVLEDPRGRILSEPAPGLTVMKGNPLYLLIKNPVGGIWKLSLSGSKNQKPPVFYNTIISVKTAVSAEKISPKRLLLVVVMMLLLFLLFWRWARARRRNLNSPAK
ncbi:MAG: vWA domain-containing protein [bacterium]